MGVAMFRASPPTHSNIDSPPITAVQPFPSDSNGQHVPNLEYRLYRLQNLKLVSDLPIRLCLPKAIAPLGRRDTSDPDRCDDYRPWTKTHYSNIHVRPLTQPMPPLYRHSHNQFFAILCPGLQLLNFASSAACNQTLVPKHSAAY